MTDKNHKKSVLICVNPRAILLVGLRRSFVGRLESSVPFCKIKLCGKIIGFGTAKAFGRIKEIMVSYLGSSEI